jgi:YaiO family outer membrane protein
MTDLVFVMKRSRMKFSILALLVLFSGMPAHAEPLNFVEVEYAHAALNSGFQSWNDVNILNYFGAPERRFIIETDYKNHFGEGAGVLGVTLTQTYNDLWYQDFSVSFATNNAVLPGVVVFSEIHRKFLADQSLVVGLGVGHNLNRDPYSDTYGLAEAYYYLTSTWSVQGGFRLNESSPGNVTTARGFASINYVTGKWDAYLRYEAGREGYTVVGDNSFKNEFASKDESAQFRYWINGAWGMGGKLDFYQSDFYNRNQVSLDLYYRY